jgi:alpha-mannosidase
LEGVGLIRSYQPDPRLCNDGPANNVDGQDNFFPDLSGRAAGRNMMKDNSPRRKTWLAVNSHGWEDFPVHQVGDKAGELLASWTALWHPLILLASGELPVWNRTDNLPDNAEGSIAVVPAFLEKQISLSARHKLEDLGGTWFTGSSSRESSATGIIGLLGIDPSGIATDVVQDFYSFGYCYLQVQLMTRQLRYVSTLDTAIISEHLIAAAQAASTADESTCREMLQRGFDQLIQERSNYYPDGGRFVDCLYLANKISISGLQETLSFGHPVSFQTSGQTLANLASAPENRDVFRKIGERIAEGSLCVVAGPASELAMPLLSLASVVRQTAKGRQSIREIFPKATCATWGSRRFGLSRSLPGILELAGFTSAVHASLDDGNFPHTAPNLTRWQGDDLTIFNALSSMPRLADSPETWLKLSIRTGEMIESHHFATEFFVHWPGAQSDSYVDLVNSQKFGEVLGRFITVDQFFSEASDPGYTQTWRADDYRDPFLAQLVQANSLDPVSRFSRYWQLSARLQTALSLHRMLMLLDAKTEICQGEDDLRESIDQLTEGTSPPADRETASHVEQLVEKYSGRLATILAGESNPVESNPVESGGGKLRINSHHFPFNSANTANTALGSKEANVPAWGYRYVPGGEDSVSSTGLLRKAFQRKKVPLVVDGIRLQNPYFYVDINPQTGGIGGICFHTRRGSVASQQLAIRSSSVSISRKGNTDGRYSQMVATRVGVFSETSEQATLESTGQLVLDGRVSGTFRQLTHLSLHEPVVRLDIDVELSEPLTGAPWQDYLCNRIAWNDDAPAIHYWSMGTRTQTSLNRIKSPMALQIEQQAGNLSLFPCGLPFHQRSGYRQLDTLLSVKGETTSHWTLGLGVNIVYPLNAAMAMMSPPLEIPMREWEANREKSGWIFHLNCKNVAVFDWPGIYGQEGERYLAGRSLRFLVRETQGRPASVRLDCFRPISQGWFCQADGARTREIAVVDGKLTWDLAAHQMAIVEWVW